MTNNDLQQGVACTACGGAGMDHRCKESCKKCSPVGMKTERVTLEITHPSPNTLSQWAWGLIVGRYCESVRVVSDDERQAPPTTKPATTENDYVPPAPVSRPAETRQTQAERVGGGWWFPKCDKPSAPPPPPPAPPRVHPGSGVFDASGDEVPWEGVVATLTAERDAAIREWEQSRERYRHCRDVNASVCDERDVLKASVAELESQLESVACRAATAETALEAASGGVWHCARTSPPPIGEFKLCRWVTTVCGNRQVSYGEGARRPDGMWGRSSRVEMIPPEQWQDLPAGPSVGRQRWEIEAASSEPISKPPQGILAERIAEVLLREDSLLETVNRLEAMSQDPGQAVVWEEFNDATGGAAQAASGNIPETPEGSTQAASGGGQVSERRTPDETLISALRILARDIQSGDGCANACLLEAAQRLEELVEERRWISVGERLPPTDAEVLFTCEIDGSFIGVYMGTSAGRMNDIGSAVIMDLDGDGDWVPCTHWKPQPLPPGPEGDA
jgi:hypothetical protein